MKHQRGFNDSFGILPAYQWYNCYAFIPIQDKLSVSEIVFYVEIICFCGDALLSVSA